MTRQKILIVDDDSEVLEVYKGLLERISSNPVIHTATSGQRALAMLEAGKYKLLVCDLKMPRMDGLQVLSIVRRKYPMLRTVALTGVIDEQFRSRVYSIGVDLYWHKPSSEQEIKQFLECLESLLGPEDSSGFRGVQSKSLMDIIQLECMSQNSAVLKIINGSASGRIWIQEGEVVDAETGEFRGEQAFLKIFSWATGSFETQHADPNRARTIFKPYNSLLLESAQALDEIRGQESSHQTEHTPASKLAQIDGLEFVLAIQSGGESSKPPFARGLENPEAVAEWTSRYLQEFETLGERLHTGRLERINGRGPQRQLTVTRQNGTQFCIGWKNGLDCQQANETVTKVLGLWGS
jgi:CheY-like chemotaxis protein